MPIYRTDQPVATVAAEKYPEPGNYFQIFPHRWDWIASPHPEPGNKPNWRTESRYPLTDQRISEGAELYGIRFGPNTNYALIDIDRGSPYHPKNDSGVGLAQLGAALEDLGLVGAITITSSISGGLHIYYPLDRELPSWKVGKAITALLLSKGYAAKPGQLEIFPQARGYSAQLSLYAGHRLPLQAGSAILNDDLDPVYSSEDRFVELWERATRRNDTTEEAFDHIIKTLCRRNYPVSSSASKFLQDLDADIEPGWTDSGQTNFLLGRIALRSYIFGHILGESPEPLNGNHLTAQIINVAQALPGFSEFCNHQDNIEQRAKDWARCVENSDRYFPYCSKRAGLDQSAKPKRPTVRERIIAAVDTLCKQTGGLPKAIMGRFKALRSFGIGSSSLYRNKSLWHPKFISSQNSKLTQNFELAFLPNGAKANQTSGNLLEDELVNSSDSKNSEPNFDLIELDDTTTVESIDPVQAARMIVSQGVACECGSLVSDKARRAKEHQERVAKLREEKAQRQKEDWAATLQGWLKSGDPVLIAEAQTMLGNS